MTRGSVTHSWKIHRIRWPHQVLAKRTHVFPSGTLQFWWTCCTRRRSRLSGGACTWEPNEESNCEHVQALLTNILQRHWEWQEDRRTDLEPGFYRYRTAFLASLDVKTAFEVIKPSVESRNLSLSGVHGHVAAALLAEMQDVQGSACFENCETEVQVLEVHPPSRSGGSNVVGTRGQIRVVESRGKVEGQRIGTCLRWRARQRVRAAGYHVGGQLIGCSVIARKDWYAW